MRIRFLVLIALILVSTAESDSIRTRVDDQGRKIFYNIPSRPLTYGGAQAIYYSRNAYQFLPLIQQICTKYGVDSELVKAVIQVESNYQPRAISPKGARGLMQLMPATAARYGVKKIFDPQQNVEGGVRYLRDLLDLFNSDLELVLAAYNAGENRVLQMNGIPNFKETQNYVRKVLALYRGDSTFVPVQAGGKPRIAVYYKYVDAKGVTHYTTRPVPGIEMTKVDFYY